ncbi:MAG: hypothetical protein ACLUHA_11730 [Bacteroides stercoris]
MNDRQNPVRLVDAVKDNRYSYYWRTFGNAYVSVKPLKGLELRTNFARLWKLFSPRFKQEV